MFYTRPGKNVSSDLQLPYNCPLTSISTGFTKNFRYLTIEVLNLIAGPFWGWGKLPYISRIHTAFFRWGFLQFRYLKCLVVGEWSKNPNPVASLLPLKISCLESMKFNSFFWDQPAYFQGGCWFQGGYNFLCTTQVSGCVETFILNCTNPRDDFFIIEMKPVAGCNGFVRFAHVSGACLAMEVWPKCCILGAYLPTFGLNLW